MTNRKSQVADRSVSVQMTLNDRPGMARREGPLRRIGIDALSSTSVTQSAMRVLTFTSERATVIDDCVALRARQSRNGLIPVPVRASLVYIVNDVTDTCSSSVSALTVYVKHSQSLNKYTTAYLTPTDILLMQT